MQQSEPASIPSSLKRKYLPAELKADSWDLIRPFFDELIARPLNELATLKQWLADKSELESFLQEDLAWRFIRMSCDTDSDEHRKSFNFFLSEIESKASTLYDVLNQKLLAAPSLSLLSGPGVEIMLRTIRKQVEIFRAENVPLFNELQQKEQEYSAISGAMTIIADGKEITLQQASGYLKNSNRNVRKEIFRKIAERRLQDRDKLDQLYNELIRIRHQIALNSGFKNYRDFMFAFLGRFDYTVSDCEKFHEAISSEVVPLLNQRLLQRKNKLGVDSLKPWDLDVSTQGDRIPVPFRGSKELMKKTIECFSAIHPVAGNCMLLLEELKHIDLDSRKGKAPGGFNYPLYETGVPFVFMNSADTILDLITIVHEGGHAIHSIMTRDLELVAWGNFPSEVVELASMSMELISMEHWSHYFKEAADLKSARQEQLEQVVRTLPWIAAIDKFQHWIYTNPDHTAEERRNQWHRIHKEFSSAEVDYSEDELYFDYIWQKQIHLYQYPFYYIEYGMAQLGALAIWRNYLSSPDTTIQQYLKALRLGYTTDIGNIYKEAGIRFDFSKKYIRELSDFLTRELDKID